MKSESRFFWQQILLILKIPFVFFLALFGKREWNELLKPFQHTHEFAREAKWTYYLILANILMFIIELIIAYVNPELFQALIFEPQDIIQLNILPIIFSWLFHAGIIHLLGNMLFLFVFGRVVEKEFGSKILLIYFASAISADIVSAIFGLGGIGASGAVAGLISTAILVKPFYITYLFFGFPMPIFIVGWLAILTDITGILTPSDSMINHFAHLGGYFAVVIVLFFVSRERKQKLFYGLLINMALVILALLFRFMIM